MLLLLGCRQVVRQRVLVPSLGGSNPSTPAKLEIKSKLSPEWAIFWLRFFNSYQRQKLLSAPFRKAVFEPATNLFWWLKVVRVLFCIARFDQKISSKTVFCLLKS